MFRRLFLKTLAMLPFGFLSRNGDADRDEAQWFVYDQDGGLDIYNSEQDALDAARDLIDCCRDGDGWPEEIENICVGKIVHTIRKEDVVRKEMLDENGCYEGRYYESHERSQFDYWCEYRIG